MDKVSLAEIKCSWLGNIEEAQKEPRILAVTLVPDTDALAYLQQDHTSGGVKVSLVQLRELCLPHKS